MNKTIRNQNLFDLHLEYSHEALAQERTYRELEGKFALAFGYLPLQVGDETFPFLTENQQQACVAFWSNAKVITSRKAMLASRTLADTYFDAFADRRGKSDVR